MVPSANLVITEFSEVRIYRILRSSLLRMLRSVGHDGTFKGIGSVYLTNAEFLNVA
jgi:hypothetical protein